MIKDHLGNEFSSISEMCRYWKVRKSTFDRRIKSGYTLEQSLTGKDVISTKTSCIDHLGNEFSSIGEMCKHWGISYATFLARRNRNYTLEQCLTRDDIRSSGISCVDHLGNEFSSITEMCKYWGVNRNTFLLRQKSGYTLEQSLTGNGVSTSRLPKSCTDHLGNKFKSKTEMCMHWGITQGKYALRIQQGYTIEQALTGEGIIQRIKPCTDHLGNKFKSKTEMCRHWGISKDIYDLRIRMGYTMRQALTGDGLIQGGKRCTDHLGNIFKDVRAMCRCYNISLDAYQRGIDSGFTLEDILTGKRK